MKILVLAIFCALQSTNATIILDCTYTMHNWGVIGLTYTYLHSKNNPNRSNAQRCGSFAESLPRKIESGREGDYNARSADQFITDRH